ncbi:MAG: hypothetical protein ACKOD9_06805, partial [Rubrivivax sp.]
MHRIFSRGLWVRLAGEWLLVNGGWWRAVGRWLLVDGLWSGLFQSMAKKVRQHLGQRLRLVMVQ